MGTALLVIRFEYVYTPESLKESANNSTATMLVIVSDMIKSTFKSSGANNDNRETTKCSHLPQSTKLYNQLNLHIEEIHPHVSMGSPHTG